MARLPDEAPSAALRRLINGYQVSQAIHVATVLDIPELLAEGPRTPDELAAATDSNGNALRRLLRALAAIGVFHEDAVDRFSLTPLGDGLQPTRPTRLLAGPPSSDVRTTGRLGSPPRQRQER